MRRSLDALAAFGLVAAFAGAASAATVRFDVVPASDTSATSVTVLPAAEVPYEIYVQVTSDNAAAADNNGLSFFTIDITTNLGTPQQPLGSFSSLIAQDFPIVQSLGTAQDDDVVQIGGGQNTFAGGNVTAGIGAGGEWQLIGQGKFVTPATEGSYTVGIGPNSQANVLQAGSLNSATQATMQAGPGFTIVVSQSATSDATDSSTTSTQTPSNATLVTLGVLGGAAILAVLAALFLSGPFGMALALVLLPLLLLILLMNIKW